MSKIEETMARLRADAEKKQAPAPAPEPKPVEVEEPMVVPDRMPTMRDLATAFYRLKQNPSCRNCLRRELGDCPSKSPRPKQCFSFQLNTRQMATYGEQAKNAIKAWRNAIALYNARTQYQYFKQWNTV